MNINTKDTQWKTEVNEALSAWSVNTAYKELPYDIRYRINEDRMSKPMLYIQSSESVRLSQWSNDTVIIPFCLVWLNPEDEKPRNYHDDLVNGLYFDDLTIDLMYWRYEFNGGYEIHSAISIEYSDVYTLQLDKAEACYKTLKHIHAKLDKYNEVWGTPRQDDINTFIIRFCKALNITEFIQPTSSYGSSYTDNSYRTGYIKDLGYTLDQIIFNARRLLDRR